VSEEERRLAISRELDAAVRAEPTPIFGPYEEFRCRCGRAWVCGPCSFKFCPRK
jgi:hypothetical protein